jgi:hypothetical protein
MSFSSESNGYLIEISGRAGRERYELRHKDVVVGRGDLRQMIAKGAARERLQQFEQKGSALLRASARLRKFDLISRPTP